MPSSIIIPNSADANAPTHKATGMLKGGSFTGDVYANMIHVTKDQSIHLVNMTFCPGSRTNWHTHVEGGFLYVLSGSGWVCDRGSEPKKLRTGDTAWIEPGTTHWHGAEEGSMITSVAAAFGETKWLEEVTDDEYAKAKGK
jgi:quercetin dioxygenase-like cupin family protein